MEPKYSVGDVIKYNGRQGTITSVFKESSFPKVMWRYHVFMRTGEWSVVEDAIEKVVKKVNDGTEQTLQVD